MNKYESIIIINSTLEDTEIKSVVEKFQTLIAENGTVESVEEWGKKRLAYPVKKHSEGYYTLYNFSSNPEFIDELERVYNITDEVLKFITIKKD